MLNDQASEQLILPTWLAIMSTQNIAKECPRWSECSVNNCPLDPNPVIVPGPAGDKQQKCPMEKGVRVRISGRHPGILKNGGLTAREASGAQIWANKSPFERSAASERIKSQLKKWKADSKDKP
jgi:hypothetical protein